MQEELGMSTEFVLLPVVLIVPSAFIVLNRILNLVETGLLDHDITDQ